MFRKKRKSRKRGKAREEMVRTLEAEEEEDVKEEE